MEYLQYLWLVLLGLGTGTLGTLIGAGGGFILMPILLLAPPALLNMLFPGGLRGNDKAAWMLKSVSLAVVCCNAASGTFWYARMKRVDFKSGVLFLLTGCPGAALGALVGKLIPELPFRLGFGLVLIAGGAYIFRKTLGKARQQREFRPTLTRSMVDSDGVAYVYRYNLALGMTLSFFIGILSSVAGIGGGIVHVPAMVSLLDFPVCFATATSQFILAVMTLVGTVVHVIEGGLAKADLVGVAALALGAMLGARLGSQLSRRINARWIMRILSIALALAGGRVLWAAIAMWLASPDQAQ
jgi:uncharacterized membrane protein YfcA